MAVLIPASTQILSKFNSEKIVRIGPILSKFSHKYMWSAYLIHGESGLHTVQPVLQ